MISDKERRRAVAELREASTGAYRHVDALDVIAGSVGVEVAGKFSHEVENETYAALADLIDRPTCRNVHDGREFECSECGMQWHLLDRADALEEWAHVRRPKYCPSCGAEVVGE